MRVESNYNPRATGSDGTVGLMQIKPRTARGLGYSGSVRELYNPKTNLEFGIRYLAGARKLAKGNVCRTVLKYQGGHGAERMTNASATYCGKVNTIACARADAVLRSPLTAPAEVPIPTSSVGRTAAAAIPKGGRGGKSGLHGHTVPDNVRRGQPQGKCHRE